MILIDFDYKYKQRELTTIHFPFIYTLTHAYISMIKSGIVGIMRKLGMHGLYERIER